jgi:hypothetical protein
MCTSETSLTRELQFFSSYPNSHLFQSLYLFCLLQMEISITNLSFVSNSNIVFTQPCKDIHQSLEQNFQEGTKSTQNLCWCFYYLKCYKHKQSIDPASLLHSHYLWAENALDSESCSPHFHVPYTFMMSKTAYRRENGTPIWYLKVGRDFKTYNG